MICCSRILVGIDDLRPVKDEEPALQMRQLFRRVANVLSLQ